MDIADKIKYLRKNILQIDETEFSKRCGVNRRTLYSWESGETKPCVENIAMIAVVCNTTINYLIIDDCELEFYFPDVTDASLDILYRIVKNYEEINEKKGTNIY